VIDLAMKGLIEEFVRITPSVVSLVGAVGEGPKARFTISPSKKYPFRILEAKAKSGDFIRLHLEETGDSDYALTVENTRKHAGRYFDTVFLITDHPIRPEIQLPVIGNISKAP
jgi:hypothetical protein